MIQTYVYILSTKLYIRIMRDKIALCDAHEIAVCVVDADAGLHFFPCAVVHFVSSSSEPVFLHAAG